MALAADLSREEHRTKMMALIGVSIGASFAISMVTGPIVNDLIGINGIFYGTAILAVVGIAILYFFVPDPPSSHFHRDAEVEPRSLMSVLKNTQLLRLDLGILILHFVLMCVFLVLPLVLQDGLGFESHQHWKIYMPVFVLSIITMVPFIIIGERKQAMKPVFVGAIACMIIAVLLFMQTPVLWLTVMALVIFFTGINLLEASLPSLITKTAPATQKGTAMGVYSSSQFFGAFAGGAIGGLAHQYWGDQGVYFTALAALSLWLILAATMKKPSHLSTYLLNVNGVSIERLLAVKGVVEATLIDDENESGQVAYLKVKKRILDEEKLLSLAASD
jgi:predicted MFS family arabinose efflux permease